MQKKNWDLLVLGPPLAMDKIPLRQRRELVTIDGGHNYVAISITHICFGGRKTNLATGGEGCDVKIRCFGGGERERDVINI